VSRSSHVTRLQPIIMTGREGGKLKPTKVRRSQIFFTDIRWITCQAPKKEKREETDEEKAFKAKQKADEAEAKKARERGTSCLNIQITVN